MVSGSCVLDCPTNCKICLPDQSCTDSDEGYFVNPGDNVVTSNLNIKFKYYEQKHGYWKQLFNYKYLECDDDCATCNGAGSCTLPCRSNCANCNPDQSCN